MINDSFRKKMLQTLGADNYFKLQDFDFTTNQRDKTTEIIISYRYKDGYFIKISVPINKSKYSNGESDYSITGVMRPGEITENEGFDAVGTGVLKVVEKWLKYVKENLSSIPFINTLEIHNEEIEKLKEIVKQLGDEYISKEDGDGYLQALNTLEEKFIENIKQVVKEQDQLNIEIRKLREEISFLKDNLYVINKRSWVSALLVRMENWAANPVNQKMLETSVKLVLPLLPGNHHNQQ